MAFLKADAMPQPGKIIGPATSFQFKVRRYDQGPMVIDNTRGILPWTLEERDQTPVEHHSAAADSPKRKGWVEPVTALVMALATVGTAWCSYQSASWTGHSNRAMNQFNILERKAGLINIQAAQVLTIQTTMFMETLAAQHGGDQKLADFYVQRFPPDLRKAYDAWIAQKPFENPNADPHPFVPNLYEMRGTREAAEATANGAKQVEDSRRAGTISRQYLANTVLFAAVLFFANAAGKFEQRRVRVPSFFFALAVFVFAVARIVVLPR